MKFINSKDSR
ncbi:hypothetical protein AB6A40_004121 [Gnathostoma spinigerum]|uniref:Uncharacterized protein n=1 Tax=Gnathostoma spinigerum TaxID=75299 RepID=A0ABD6EDR5_9BILA